MATNAERRAAKIEFATRANQFTQTARALLEEWERCEMQTGETPAEVPYYPFHESLDEQIHEIIKWNENVSKWANDPDNLEAPCAGCGNTPQTCTCKSAGRYLVVSCDDDSNFYHDLVIAESDEDAEGKVLAIRDYCIGADAVDLPTMKTHLSCLATWTDEKINQSWGKIVAAHKLGDAEAQQ